MTVDDTAPVLHVPAADPNAHPHQPAGASDARQGAGSTVPGPPPGRSRRVAQEDRRDGRERARLTAGSPAAVDATVAEIEVDGAHVYVITPKGIGEEDHRVFLDVHGGVYVLGWQVPSAVIQVSAPPDG